jgi:hypothetical protein
MKEDPDRIVILQKDAEGNEYRVASGVWSGLYIPHNNWCGEAALEIKELTPELIARGFTEDDINRDGQRALFIRPIN